MPTTRLTILFDLYLNNSCTPAEKQELAELILSKEHDATISQVLEQVWSKTTGEADMPDEKVEHIFHSILTAESKPIPRVHRIHFRRLRWWAAAAIFILFVTGSYFLFFNNKGGKQNEIVKTEPDKDVKAPSTNRAMITLADGRTVFLDSALNGELAVQGNVKLVKLANGQIAYQTETGEIVKQLQYNTLSNPRGSKVIDMTLADGSRVWLNAGSSITYPVTFVGKERKVVMNGEGYFEVAHDANRPFYVGKDDMSVQVLGTHFNVNAYDDESEIKVTLLEGSVKVSKEGLTGLLKPGQQARVNGEIRLVENADIEQVMAWKHGLFSFNKVDIKTVMREVARWYDVEVVYTADVKETFYIKTSRNTSVSNIFKILETTGGVHFEVEGKKIIVKP